MDGSGGSSDRDLVARFRAGDRGAFEALYRRHFPAVFRFAFYMTRDRLSAGELTQDVFVWLVHHAGEFDAGRGDVAAFLMGVARKFLHRRQRSELRWAPFEETSDQSAFAAVLERQQETAALHRAIAALPERYREAVVLCDLEGKSYEEAAVISECAVGTVRSRLHRARELLARKFTAKREGQRCL
jgi:RNA polymerase sigma-70 factor (ECF subfamily)